MEDTVGCNCGGSSYGMAEGAPGEADPFYWNGAPAAPAKPDTAKPSSTKKDDGK